MKVALTGASGFIGRRLAQELRSAGSEVLAFQRIGENIATGPYWNPDRGIIDGDALEGVDAVIHLAGENVASGRWTQAQKDRIMQSRVNGTRLLVQGLVQGLGQTLHRTKSRPRVFLSASGVGYYGNRGDAPLDESSSKGEGFLSDVCQAWEEEALPLEALGVRVVFLRFGMVLSKSGGALKKMLPPFRLGAGGRLGSGRQYISWIALDDAVQAILHCLNESSLSGSVNVVSPNPVRNAEFTRTLARVLHRPALFPVPALLLKTLLGEMAEELLLPSARAVPGKLNASKFSFNHAELEETLRTVLSPPVKPTPHS